MDCPNFSDHFRRILDPQRVPIAMNSLYFQDAFFLQLLNDAVCYSEHGDSGRNTTINGGLQHRFLYLEFCTTVGNSPSAVSVNNVYQSI